MIRVLRVIRAIRVMRVIRVIRVIRSMNVIRELLARPSTSLTRVGLEWVHDRLSHTNIKDPCGTRVGLWRDKSGTRVGLEWD